MSDPAPIRINAAFQPLVEWTFPGRYLVLTGGRGSGKSFAKAAGVAILCRQPGYRVLFTRYTLASAEDSIIPEVQAQLQRLGLAGEYVTRGANLTHRQSGSDILFRGIRTSAGNQTAKLKSLSGVNVWVLDEAEECEDEDEFETIDLSIRDSRRPCKVVLGLNPPHVGHWLYRRHWQPYGLPDDYTGTAPDGWQHIHTDYRSNRRNLPPEMIQGAEGMRVNDPVRYRHVWLGHWAREAEGALWRREWLDKWRLAPGREPGMRRIVVAIDIATTSGEDADATGIVAAGLGEDSRGYILDDLSMPRATPLQWATVAVAAYHARQADRIVAESNQGGELISTVIHQVDPNVPVALVHASRGKVTRAEPAAALYEQGRISHVGQLSALEGELVSYTGQPGEDSPNRLDAAVWALTELFGLSPKSGADGGTRYAGIASRAVLPSRG